MPEDFRGLMSDINYTINDTKRKKIIAYLKDFIGNDYSTAIFNMPDVEVGVLWDYCVKTKTSLEAL